MMFLGLFGLGALGALSDARRLDNDFEEEAHASFNSEQRAPEQYQYPSMPSPYLGTLTGMCRRCGSEGIVILPSPFSSPFSSSTRAWCYGMRAYYEGFGQEARHSQRARLQAMADGELFDLMEEIVQESKRRRSSIWPQ